MIVINVTIEFFQSTNEKIEEIIITTEKKHQLAYCHVPKVASSLWMMAFAEMNNIDKNLAERLLKRNALHGAIMTNFSFPLGNNPKEIEDFNKSDLYKFVFIRHPFERLVSAFHDKFEVKKQGDIMVPFLRHEIIKNMFQELKKPKSQKLSSFFNLSFENFINFVLEEASYNVISEPSKHWWPYSDLCKLCKVKYDFIGSLESLKEDSLCMLSNFKEYELLQKMKDRLKMKINAEGKHTREMTMEYFANLSKETISKLYELYKVDFVLGNYEFPQAYINIGKA